MFVCDVLDILKISLRISSLLGCVVILSWFKEFHKSFEMSRDLCRSQCFVLCISGNMFKFSCDVH